MILTLIFLALVVLGVIGIIIWENDLIENWEVNEKLGITGAFVSIFSGIALIICILIIISSHCTANVDIQKNRIYYEGLNKRIEVINSDYEDVSKSDVISDVTEWNKDVYSAKYWNKSPWTSWFWDDDFVNSLEYIEL